MREHRITWAAAERVGEALSERDWAILGDVDRCRVLTGAHLERLHFHDLSVAHRDRTRRRVLARLTNLAVLTPLERRIGGARAGSSGLVFALGLAGQRLRNRDEHLERSRQPHTPTVRFLRHNLAVSELYVRLVERARSGGLNLLTFRAEPDAWWSDDAGGWVKPDAYLVVSRSNVEDNWTVEIDMATESLPTVQRKLRVYLDLADRGLSGPDDTPLPRVLIAAVDERRVATLQVLIDSLPAPANDLFVVTTTALAPTCIEDALRDER